MFPKVQGGCTFCAGKDVKHFQFSGNKYTHSGACLPVAHVSIKEVKPRGY